MKLKIAGIYARMEGRIMETIVIEDYIILKDLVNAETRRKSFGYLLSKYQQDVYFFIRHQALDHEDTDEITHDVFLNVYKNAGTLNLTDELEGIIYGFAAQACRHYFRSRPQEEWLPSLTGHLKQHSFSIRDMSAKFSLPLHTVKDAYQTWLTKQTTLLNA